MPRVPQLKCHLRFHPANSAATNAIRRPFKYDVHQKQTNLQRLLVALHVTRPTVPVALEDMLEQISAQAADNEEVLGCRWNRFVHVALSVLRKNGYLELQVREDGVEYCWLTEDGMRIMRDADVGFGDLWNHLSSFERCRRVGQHIQWQISPNLTRLLTRRELDLEIRELERQQQEHKKVCPLLLGLDPCQTRATLQNEIPHDVMDVDEVPVVGPSTTQTPIRKSASVHNPAAYPTPQSLPRARSPASLPSPQTPLARHHSSIILGGNQSSDDAQVDNRVVIIVLNKGKIVIDQVAQGATCHNMDWQNITHVTAVSKFLQERNDVLQQEKEDLQQKMGVLAREKEECTHQLDEVNSKVGYLEAEKRDLQSQSWLFRWCSVVRMTVLQRALDSAIEDRERHQHENARLQARLDGVKRRRAAIRRIEDAENAPDDHLLAEIARHLRAQPPTP